MTAKSWLRKNLLETFSLPLDAVNWLCQFYDCLQFFDDVIDGDTTISRSQFNQALWDALIGVQLNPFYIQNSYQLLPLIGTMILKWQASDQAERAGRADEKSYVWRAGYYDLVLMVINICHGHEVATEVAEQVLNLYGETYQDYKQEFDHA